LIEYQHIPEESQIEHSLPPLLSPYNVFRRNRSDFAWISSIRKLISTPRKGCREYIQSSRMDQVALHATSAEQYVDLEISKELIKQWRAHDYVALHLGAVRLMLTLHGRKGLPVTARVTLLDSTYQKYEQAVIGTILTTLNTGSAVLTIFPNFNVQLKDPTLPNRFKVQVQLVGAPQDEAALSATLHHQIIYRIQDHCFDLPRGNALLVTATDDQETPTIVQVPRQIPREELRSLIPTEWISNYENFKNKEKQIVATEATFRRNSVDGSVKTTFKWKEEGETNNPPPVFHTMMITLGDKERKIPVHCFQNNGKAIFSDKLNGHFLWDVDSSKYDPYCNHGSDSEPDFDSDDEDDPNKKKRCKSPPKPTRKSDPDNGPWIGIRKKAEPLPIYKKGLKTLRKEGYLPPPANPNLITWPPPKNCSNLFQPKQKELEISCFMFKDEDFPTLERKSDPEKGISSKPFIQSTEILPEGTHKPLSQAEEVLNWQTSNSLSQNSLLKVIGKKVDKMT